jgi:hypothetical protein
VRYNDKGEKLSHDSTALEQMRNSLLLHERVVLNTLSFDVSVEHPHKHAEKMLKVITSGQPREQRELLQATINILNDSLSTTMCLRYHPRLITAAAVSLAVRLLRSRAQAQQQKPRYVEIFARFEKQGEVFGFSPQEIRPVEEELVKMYEKYIITPTQ